MIARREAIDTVGFMDEGFFLHSEEVDWGYRFRQSGCDVRFRAEQRALAVRVGTSGPSCDDASRSIRLPAANPDQRMAKQATRFLRVQGPRWPAGASSGRDPWAIRST